MAEPDIRFDGRERPANLPLHAYQHGQPAYAFPTRCLALIGQIDVCFAMIVQLTAAGQGSLDQSGRSGLVATSLA